MRSYPLRAGKGVGTSNLWCVITRIIDLDATSVERIHNTRQSVEVSIAGHRINELGES